MVWLGEIEYGGCVLDKRVGGQITDVIVWVCGMDMGWLEKKGKESRASKEGKIASEGKGGHRH